MKDQKAQIAALTTERDRLRRALFEASVLVASIAVDHPKFGGVESIRLCQLIREPLGDWHPDHDYAIQQSDNALQKSEAQAKEDQLEHERKLDKLTTAICEMTSELVNVGMARGFSLAVPDKHMLRIKGALRELFK